MESLKLSELELRTYAELFHVCDVENTGKITGNKAAELFLTSGLPQELLQQVTELCGAKRLGHFGRSQFYVALKLISVAQCGLPLTSESFNTGVDVPLPQFGRQLETDGGTDGWHSQDQGISLQLDQKVIHLDSCPGSLGPVTSQHQPPVTVPPSVAGKHPGHVYSTTSNTSTYDQTRRVQSNLQGSPLNVVSPQFSPDSPPCSPTLKYDTSVTKPEPVHLIPGQDVQPPCAAAGVISEQYIGGNRIASPTSQQQSTKQYEAHSKVEKGWASFEVEDDNKGLEPAENKQWASFPEPCKATDTSSISSEAESIDDVWAITDEQREYYVNQFKSMQSDLNGVIIGSIAKEFFEKSKLPVPELKKIWQLSDVDRDGSLSLEEFCTAMHLVVLRRNDVELPDNLPPVLMPYVAFVNPDEPFAADLPPGSTMLPGSTLGIKSHSPTSPSLQPAIPHLTTQQSWPAAFPSASPTSSSVSSPGTKPTPVNFDFRPITDDRDSQIVHPVALRMSPDGQPIPVENAEPRSAAFSVDTDIITQEGLHEAPLSPSRQPYVDSCGELGGDAVHTMHLHTPLQGRPRPTPKKAQSISGPTMDGPGQPLIIKPPPSSQEFADRPDSLAVGESAPPPPPRAKPGHSRSSSLDNQLVDLSEFASGQLQLMPPPAVPPRPSPKESANSFGTASSNSGTQDAPDSGVATGTLCDPKARTGSREDIEELNQVVPAPSVLSQKGMDKRDLHQAIRKQKQQNTMQLRLNNELNQELQEVMEQRIALEIQLEHLKPFST